MQSWLGSSSAAMVDCNHCGYNEPAPSVSRSETFDKLAIIIELPLSQAVAVLIEHLNPNHEKLCVDPVDATALERAGHRNHKVSSFLVRFCSIPFITIPEVRPSFLSLLLIVAAQIRGHIAGSSPPLPTTVSALHFSSREHFIPFFLRRLASNGAYPRLVLSAVDSFFFLFANQFTISPRWDSNSSINENIEPPSTIHRVCSILSPPPAVPVLSCGHAMYAFHALRRLATIISGSQDHALYMNRMNMSPPSTPPEPPPTLPSPVAFSLRLPAFSEDLPRSIPLPPPP